MLDQALGSTDMMTVWKIELPSQCELITGEFIEPDRVWCNQTYDELTTRYEMVVNLPQTRELLCWS